MRQTGADMSEKYKETSLGGLAVNAGDLIVADEDGVVVVPADRIKETTESLAKVLAAEAARLEEVRQGRRTMLG